jgi:hypothetical protein
MNHEQKPPVSSRPCPTIGKPVAGADSGLPPLPASLLVLKRKVSNEQTTCWVLIALAALTGAVAFVIAGEYMLGAVGLFAAAMGDFAGSAGSSIQLMSLFSGLLNLVLSVSLALVAPAGIVILSVIEYNRHYRLTAGDLVWNDLALFLMHDEYGVMIDQARQERFSPNPNPVELGEDLGQRLQHFAAYYSQYRRLAQPKGDLKLPMVIERNCWADGGLLVLGACLSTCCVGVVLAIPMIARVASTWPRQVAIKQAVVHFFEGRFDQALEEQWQQRHAGSTSENSA